MCLQVFNCAQLRLTLVGPQVQSFLCSIMLAAFRKMESSARTDICLWLGMHEARGALGAPVAAQHPCAGGAEGPDICSRTLRHLCVPSRALVRGPCLTLVVELLLEVLFLAAAVQGLALCCDNGLVLGQSVGTSAGAVLTRKPANEADLVRGSSLDALRSMAMLRGQTACVLRLLAPGASAVSHIERVVGVRGPIRIRE